MQRGAQKAVADLNAKGGVMGSKVKLEVGDDACDPKQAVAVANQMVSKGVIFMAGHFCSGSSIPASEVYNDEGVLQISPASTNPALTDRGFDNVLRVCGRDDQQGIIAGNYLADHYKGKKIAIVHDKQTYSKGLADATKDQLHKRGLKEALYDTVNAGEKDYSAFVTKLKQMGIDVLYYGGYHTEAGLIVRQMRAQGMKTQLVSGDALVTDEFWAITGDSGEGTLMTFGPDPRNKPAAKEVVKRFRKDGYEPEGYTLYTYAAVQVWAQAVEKAKSFDLDKVLQTVLGPISFDKKGDIKQPAYVFYVWHSGKYSEMM
jgi:branched-chain amino acid transport system substrate-binding protein